MEKLYWDRIFFPRLLSTSHNRTMKAENEEALINNDDTPCNSTTVVSAPLVSLSSSRIPLASGTKIVPTLRKVRNVGLDKRVIH